MNKLLFAIIVVSAMLLVGKFLEYSYLSILKIILDRDISIWKR